LLLIWTTKVAKKQT